MPFFNEAAYCLGVERLLGIEDQIPERAQLIRVLMMELNRISSHLGGIGAVRPGTRRRPRSSCRACGCGRTSSTCSS